MRKLPRKVFCVGIFLEYFLHPFSSLITYKTVLVNKRIREIASILTGTSNEQKCLSSSQNILNFQIFLLFCTDLIMKSFRKIAPQKKRKSQFRLSH